MHIRGKSRLVGKRGEERVPLADGKGGGNVQKQGSSKTNTLWEGGKFGKNPPKVQKKKKGRNLSFPRSRKKGPSDRLIAPK